MRAMTQQPPGYGPPGYGGYGPPAQNHPQSTTVLVLGILGIVGSALLILGVVLVVGVFVVGGILASSSN